MVDRHLWIEVAEYLGVAIGVEKHAREPPPLGDVQRIFALAKCIELAPEPGTEVFSSDDSGHVSTVE